jgi:nucleoside-diphosphate-sugar epimerase
MIERKTVFVTGAGGFIGGRVVELLHASGRYSVKAGVRRWSSAARIGRLPVDIVLCDITDPDDLRRAVEDVDLIVHCAVGDRRATVVGTRNVFDAAFEAGVERLVHISTIDVYGDRTGPVPEDVALTRTGREYGDTKIEAEEICQEFIQRGLPTVILRPTIVYGPFSELWTLAYAWRFLKGTWLLPVSDCQGTCNLVYVDDLVAAILRAMTSEDAVGQAFNVNGDDQITWNDYFHALNNAMGLPPLASPRRSRARLSAALVLPVRVIGKFALNRLSGLVVTLYQRYAVVKRCMRFAESVIRQTPSGSEFRMYSKVVSFPTDKAERILGYRPVFPMQDGVAFSAAWLRHHGHTSV